jgi:acyl-CoA thioesterase-1
MARMKRHKLAVLFVGACVCFATVNVRAQVRILPYGDSVTTFGSGEESSYRYELYQDLVNAGFDPINGFRFVGTALGCEDGPPANSWPQEAYAGHEGWTSQDAALNANSVASATSPDIVLLDFGSNDIENPDLTATEGNLEQTVETFRARNSNVIVLIAVPTKFTPDPALPKTEQHFQKSQQSKLAGIIGKVVSTEKRAGANIIKVNQFGGFNPKSDTKDGSHPNVQGEQKIAKKYFAALKKVL